MVQERRRILLFIRTWPKEVEAGVGGLSTAHGRDPCQHTDGRNLYYAWKEQKPSSRAVESGHDLTGLAERSNSKV